MISLPEAFLLRSTLSSQMSTQSTGRRPGKVGGARRRVEADRISDHRYAVQQACAQQPPQQPAAASAAISYCSCVARPLRIIPATFAWIGIPLHAEGKFCHMPVHHQSTAQGFTSVQGYAQTNGRLQNGAAPYSHASGQHGAQRQPGGGQPWPQHQASAGAAPARAPPARPARAPRAAAAPSTQVRSSTSPPHNGRCQPHKASASLLRSREATGLTG